MLELRIRACHVHGQFIAVGEPAPAVHARRGDGRRRARDLDRITLPPASYVHERRRSSERWPAAVRFIEERKLNEFFEAEDGGASDIGIIVQGGHYNTLLRSLERLGLADVYGRSQVPLYVMNVTYPVIESEVLRFCRRQARRADRRGRPAQLHRAEPGDGPSPRRLDDRAARQGPAAARRRVHARRRPRRAARLPRALRTRSRRRIARSRRRSRSRRPTLAAARRTRGRRAFAPAAPSGRSSAR